MARILRFDRAGFEVTQAFNWLEEQSVFPTFFLRLYNPPGSYFMDGEDDTIRDPTAEEKLKLYAALCRHGFYAERYPTFEEATRYTRCIKAVRFDFKDGKRVSKVVSCLTVHHSLSYAGGMFGRATRVSRVMLKEDLNSEKPTIYALKVVSLVGCAVISDSALVCQLQRMHGGQSVAGPNSISMMR
jgi:hypothetical protein